MVSLACNFIDIFCDGVDTQYFFRCNIKLLVSYFSRRYDSFVNWDFFPSVQLPILVYFKETQTPKVSNSRRFMIGMKKVLRHC